METRKLIRDIDPRDLEAVERVFGQRIEASTQGELILKLAQSPAPNPAATPRGLPDWCNVLEGMSDADLADVNAAIEAPVRLTRHHDIHGT